MTKFHALRRRGLGHVETSGNVFRNTPCVAHYSFYGILFPRILLGLRMFSFFTCCHRFAGSFVGVTFVCTPSRNCKVDGYHGFHSVLGNVGFLYPILKML